MSASLGSVLTYLLPSVLVLYLFRKYRESKWGKCTNNVDLSGRVAIITGANSGIGFEIAKELANRKAHTILACRSLDRANKAIAKIKEALGHDDIVLVSMELDLSSFDSITKFSKEISTQYERIDILINNAGVAYPKNSKAKTKDGLEVQFQVNYLGHFFLTKLLLDKLLKSDYKRVVIITSSLLERGSIDLDKMGSVEEGKTTLYSNSKLANAYFCQELAKRNTHNMLRVYGVCPGWIYTNLFRHSIKWYHYFLVAPIAYLFMRSAKQGSETAIFCATEPSLAEETGLVYRDCQHYKLKYELSDKVSHELWDKSESIISEILSNKKSS